MNKLTLLSTLFVLLLLLPINQTAASLILSLEPSATSINVNESVSIDLNISGLGSFSAPSLGAFAIDLYYDPSLFGLSDVQFGSFLGDPTFDAISFFDSTSFPGSVYVEEVSFLPDFELDFLQPDAFTLATLEFTSFAEGAGDFGLSFADLSDAGFPPNSLLVEDLETALTSVTVDAEQVPEPGTLLLISIAVFVMLRIRAKASV